MPRLQWQGSPLIELHHITPTRVGALLAYILRPAATAELAAQINAASHTYVHRMPAMAGHAAHICMPHHTYSRKVLYLA